MPAFRHLMFLLFLLPGASGCELLQRTPAETDGSGSMMIADEVPLATHDTGRRPGAPMPVPVEPSPFERAHPDNPHAMLSDIQPPRSPTEKADAEPRAIPDEPLP